MTDQGTLPAYIAWFGASLAWPVLLLVGVRSPRWRVLVPWAAALLALPFIAGLVVVIRPRLANPPVWDFWSIWLWGRTALAGGSPYSVPDLVRYSHDLPGYVPDFTRGVLSYHTSYPPFSLLLFAAAGAFPVVPGITVWYGLSTAGTLLAVIQLSRRFAVAEGPANVLLIAALILLLRPTLVTAALAQSNMLALCALVLAWPRPRGQLNGAALFLLVAVKPFLVILLLQPLLGRHWRSVVTCLGIMLAVTLAFDAATPADLISGYLSSASKFARLHEHYWEPGTESLLSIVLRTFDPTRATREPLLYAPALLSALPIVGLTLAALLRGGRTVSADGIALLVPAALLLYPATYAHFAVLLAVPMLHLWVDRARLALSDAQASTLLAASLLMLSYFGGVATGGACLLLWLVFTRHALRRAPAPTDVSAGRSQAIPVIA